MKIPEQHHRARSPTHQEKNAPNARLQKLVRPQRTLDGIEAMAMIKKGQMKTSGANKISPAEMFYALAA